MAIATSSRCPALCTRAWSTRASWSTFTVTSSPTANGAAPSSNAPTCRTTPSSFPATTESIEKTTSPFTSLPVSEGCPPPAGYATVLSRTTAYRGAAPSAGSPCGSTERTAAAHSNLNVSSKYRSSVVSAITAFVRTGPGRPRRGARARGRRPRGERAGRRAEANVVEATPTRTRRRGVRAREERTEEARRETRDHWYNAFLQPPTRGGSPSAVEVRVDCPSKPIEVRSVGSLEKYHEIFVVSL